MIDHDAMLRWSETGKRIDLEAVTVRGAYAPANDRAPRVNRRPSDIDRARARRLLRKLGYSLKVQHG